jgi:hypothetical protein
MNHRTRRPSRLGLAILALSLTIAPLATPAAAQGGPDDTPAIGPIFARAIKHDVSRPLREIGPVPQPFPPGFAVEVAMGEVERQRPEPARVEDPLRQTQARPFPEASLTPTPSIDFEGLASADNTTTLGFSVLPPDTQGDVGTDYYVQWVNLIFAVYNKATGAIVPGGGPFAGNSLWASFGAPCEAENDGDPIVLYDHLAGRWLLSHFAVNQGTQCVALSQTGDPLGTYDRWAFVVSPGQQNDYPKIGVMPDAYYLSVRDFPALTGTFAGFIAMDRTAMLAGDAGAGFVKFGLPCDTASNNCPDYVQPPHLEGPAPPAGTPGFFTKVWDDDFEGPWSGAFGLDGYRIWKFVPDFATPGNSTFAELPMVPASADFSTDMCGGARSCIQQPTTGAGPLCVSSGIGCPDLDAIADGQMYRAQYRHWAGSHDGLVLTNTVDATGADLAGSRWVELRNPDPAGAGAWALFQDGTYAPADGVNRWMGSAAMDQVGNIALGYSVTRRDPEVFPGVRYTSREAGDPPGTMPGGEIELIAGGAIQTSFSNRWGDYSSMSVDPTDDCTFWYTQEYIGAGSSSWRTRIGAFKLDSCGAASIAGAPTPNDFGAVEVTMSSLPQPITLTNDGALDYDVTGLTLSNTTDFLLDPSPAGDPCGAPPFSLAVGADCDVEVTFTPQSQAVFAETLAVATDASGVEAVIDLAGTGFTPCTDPMDDQTLTGTGSGTVNVSTCKTVTLDAYDFSGGTLTVVTGETIYLLDGTSLADTVSLAIDPFKALP